jgi:hypothetical protein
MDSAASVTPARPLVTASSTSPSRVRSPLPPARKVDRYGFYVEEDVDGFRLGDPHRPQSGQVQTVSRAMIRLENLRIKKWLVMLDDWRTWNVRMTKRLRKRVRKGIPDALRGRVWMQIAEADALKTEHPGLYASLLTRQPKRADISCIMLDLPRTMPTHYLFSVNDNSSSPLSPASSLVADADLPPGQRTLKNVLSAYAVYDPAVGYCQGMAFCASLLLSYMPEEDAFFMLHVLMRSPRYALAGMYSPGLPLFAEVMHVFSSLARLHMPHLIAHMEELGIDHSMYASQWFMTLFTYNLPFDIVTRVWDMFLFEGWKAVYRIALALLKLNQAEMLTLDFDGVVDRLKSVALLTPPQEIINVALKIRITRRQIERMHSEYRWTHQHEIRLRVEAAVMDAEKREQYLARAAASDLADQSFAPPAITAGPVVPARVTVPRITTEILDEESSDEDQSIRASSFNTSPTKPFDIYPDMEELEKFILSGGVSLHAPGAPSTILLPPVTHTVLATVAEIPDQSSCGVDTDPSRADTEEEEVRAPTPTLARKPSESSEAKLSNLQLSYTQSGRRESNNSGSSAIAGKFLSGRRSSSNSTQPPAQTTDRRDSASSPQKGPSSAKQSNSYLNNYPSVSESAAVARARAMDAGGLSADVVVLVRSPTKSAKRTQAPTSAPVITGATPVTNLLSKASAGSFKLEKSSPETHRELTSVKSHEATGEKQSPELRRGATVIKSQPSMIRTSSAASLVDARRRTTSSVTATSPHKTIAGSRPANVSVHLKTLQRSQPLASPRSASAKTSGREAPVKLRSPLSAGVVAESVTAEEPVDRKVVILEHPELVESCSTASTHSSLEDADPISSHPPSSSRRNASSTSLSKLPFGSTRTPSALHATSGRVA